MDEHNGGIDDRDPAIMGGEQIAHRDHICLQQATIGWLKGKIEAICGYMKEGIRWRIVVFVQACTIVGMLVMFAVGWGTLKTQVAYHEKVITKLEVLIDELRSKDWGQT